MKGATGSTVLPDASVEEHQKLGLRLKVAREAHRLTLEQAAVKIALEGFTSPQISAANIAQIEQNGHLSPELFMVLTHVYEVSAHALLHSPYPYKTEREWLEAYHNEAITLGTLAQGLGVSLVEASEKANHYEFTEALDPKHWTETKGLTTPEFKITLQQDGGLSFMFTLDPKSRYRAVVSAGSTQALAMFLRDNVHVPEPPTQESVDEIFKDFKPHRVTE